MTWVNRDPFSHDVKATKGASFTVGMPPGKQTFVYPTDEPDTLSYVCTIHPGMKGKIIITR